MYGAVSWQRFYQNEPFAKLDSWKETSELLHTSCRPLFYRKGPLEWIIESFSPKRDNGGWSGSFGRLPSLPCSGENQYQPYQLIYDTNTLANLSPKQNRGIVLTFDWSEDLWLTGTALSGPRDCSNCFTSVQRFLVIGPSPSICLPFSFLVKALIGLSGAFSFFPFSSRALARGSLSLRGQLGLLASSGW